MKDYREKINKHLEEFLDKEDNDMKEYYSVIKSYVLTGGKRLRPTAVLLSYLSSGGKELEKMYLPAIAIELHHAYSLILDDIMDEDDSRRGNPTVHERLRKKFPSDKKAKLFKDISVKTAVSFAMMLGNLTNILSKKAIFASVFPKEIKYKALELLEKTDQLLYHGQMMDLLFESKKPTEEEYMEMARLKTGMLFGLSFQLGSLFAGRDENTHHLFREFGINLGLSFQIQDDLGDVGQDRRAGKNTLATITDENHCRKTISQIKEKTKKILEQLDVEDKAAVMEFSEFAIKLP